MIAIDPSAGSGRGLTAGPHPGVPRTLNGQGVPYQGELNVELLEYDACQKLAHWFDDRWNDRFCLELSQEFITVIEECWAREEPLTPYEVYCPVQRPRWSSRLNGAGKFRQPRGNKSAARGSLGLWRVMPGVSTTLDREPH